MAALRSTERNNQTDYRSAFSEVRMTLPVCVLAWTETFWIPLLCKESSHSWLVQIAGMSKRTTNGIYLSAAELR